MELNQEARAALRPAIAGFASAIVESIAAQSEITVDDIVKSIRMGALADGLSQAAKDWLVTEVRDTVIASIHSGPATA